MKNKEERNKRRRILKNCSLGLAAVFAVCTTSALFTGCTDGKDGKDGATWYSGTATPNLINNPGKQGDFYYDEDDGIIYKLTGSGWTVISTVSGGGTGSQGPQGPTGPQGPVGPAGSDGQDGTTPHIGANGNWWIGTTDTGVKAQGDKGENGQNGQDGQPGKDGQDGEDGQNGVTPHIGANGNWWIGTEDTGYSAIGEDGQTPTIGISDDGYWIINGEETTFSTYINKNDLLKNLSGIIEYDLNNSTFEVYHKPYDTLDFNSGSYANANKEADVFTGWSGIIGKPEKIDSIKFKFNANPYNAAPIQKVTVFLKERNKDGKTLFQEDLSVYVKPGDVKEVIWNLPEKITNTQNINYYFGYCCDGYCGRFLPFPSQKLPEDEEQTKIGYMTSYNDISKIRDGNGDSYLLYMPVEVGILEPTFKLTDSVIEQLKSQLNITKNYTEIALPKNIRAFVGQTMQIYFDNIVSFPLDEVLVSVSCNNKGKIFDDRWEYTPTAAENFNLEISVYTKYYELLEKQVFSVVVDDTTTKTSTKVLVLGDSTVNNGGETNKILSLAGLDEGFDVELLGTRGNSANKHEGYGGWSTNTFVNSASAVVGGKGDPVTNPFYNPETSTFDFSYYMTNQSYDAVDVVFIQLGINDMASANDSNRQTKIEQYLANMQVIINSIKAFNPDIKIVVNLITLCTADQNLFAESFDSRQTAWGAALNFYLTNLELEKTFASVENVYTSWFNASLDRTKIKDAVHPTDEGYNQLGTQMYYFLKSIV